MRGLDQTSGRGWLCAGAWLVFWALVAPASAWAQPSGGEETGPPGSEGIDLAADRILVWQVDGVRWAILEGRAAVFQGTDGLRAERAVARITPRADQATRVEIYAEGVESTDQIGRKRRQWRTTRATTGPVRYRPYTRGGLTQADRAPVANPLLSRAFPSS
ncbi:MAG: hypothetical protein IRY99_08090, partial [Isosphaeraceae bacterium]|nr:hypothetical protein [Isosphaeraceae bacterium]